MQSSVYIHLQNVALEIVEFILQDPTHFFALLLLVCKGKKGPGSPGTFKKSPGTFGLL